jgi:RecA-family ATPase
VSEIGTFYRSASGYVAVRDEGGIQVEISRLKRRSDGLQGEVVVSAAVVPRLGGRLHEAMFNISSTVARDRLVKTLVERSRPEAFPWDELIEEFCSRVLEAERQGTPVVTLGNGLHRTGELMLVDPLLVDYKPTICFAQGGTGKSYLAVLLSVAVSSGIDVMGWSTKRSGKVLYLDWEADAEEVDMRVRRVANGLGVTPPNILYRSMSRPLDDSADQIARTVEAEGVILVVVDSVGIASGSAREHSDASETAIRLFSAFRLLGCAVLAIDHVTGEDARNHNGAIAKPYGSIYKVNLARSVWELRGTNDEHGDTHLALYHRKVNAGRLHDAIGLRVEHTNDATLFQPEEVDDPSLVSGLTQSARIERVLRDGAATAAAIATETGLTPSAVRVVLGRGSGSLFTKNADGTWENS